MTENTNNTEVTEMQSKTISVKRGLNRIKIVGYESPRIQLKLHIEIGEIGSSD